MDRKLPVSYTHLRSIENLYTNAAKYALENTRVYVELEKADKKAVFTIKNVSKNELDIVSNGNVDLTERDVYKRQG